MKRIDDSDPAWGGPSISPDESQKIKMLTLRMRMPDFVPDYNELSSFTRRSTFFHEELREAEVIRAAVGKALTTWRQVRCMGRTVCSRFPEVPPPRALAAKRRAEDQGRNAEARVARHWESQGYQVLAQRLRTPSGEIDLVVANPENLIFIEVKFRKTMAEAAYAVQPRQQARLFQAADLALAAHEDWSRPNIRFDVALVCGAAMHHIQDAIRF